MRRATQLRVAGVLAAAAVGLAGCGTPPPGTAAEVGPVRIETSSLQQQVDTVLAYRDSAGLPDVRDQLPEITRQVLSADVVHELTTTAVADTGVAVDRAAIDAQVGRLTDAALAQEGLTFLTPDSLRSVVGDQLTVAQLGEAAWDGLAVTVDITVAPDARSARDKAARMAGGEEASAAVVAEDTAAGLPAQAGLELTPATAPALAGYPVFPAEVGSAVAFQFNEQWQVARIVSRRTDAPASTVAGATSAAQADTTATYALGLTLLPRLAGEPPITISPRYGEWDPTQTQVVDPAADRTAFVVPAPRA